MAKKVQGQAVAEGTIVYKGRTLKYQWPRMVTKVTAILCHQGFATEEQIKTVYPKAAALGTWPSWYMGTRPNSSNPDQRPGEVVMATIGGQPGIALKSGASPMSWVEDSIDLEEALALAPKDKKVVLGVAKAEKVKVAPTPKPKSTPTALLEEEDEDDEDLEEEEDDDED